MAVRTTPVQPRLIAPLADDARAFADPTFGRNRAEPFHRWVGWVAGYSADFVRDALARYAPRRGTVLDPFAGVGTTLVEATAAGQRAVGFETNPYAAFIARVKAQAPQASVQHLRAAITRYQRFARDAERRQRVPDSAPPPGFHSRADFFAPAVLVKVLTLLDFIATLPEGALRDLFRLAFAATLISYSQYSYEPSLSRRVTAGKPEILDADVCAIVVHKLRLIADDMAQWKRAHRQTVPATVHHASFFAQRAYLTPGSVDLVVTSPPYLNNYHYNRNTRPHIFWLGLAQEAAEMCQLEQLNFGKFWQTVRDQPPIALDFALPDDTLETSLAGLRTLHPEKGIYGGAGWANYAASYFNDCRRFVTELAVCLRPGGHALVVVGNSILQGQMIPTDVYLGQIAQQAGLELVSISVPRSTRVGNSIIRSDVRVTAAAERHTLYEAVVVVRQP